ncbi:MAG: glycosyltransferase family 39 protein [Chloroflexota bacterium]
MADTSTHNPLPEPRARWLVVAGIVAAITGLVTALFARARLATRSALVTDEPNGPMAIESASVGLGTPPRPVVPSQIRPASPRRTLTFIILTVLVALVLIVLQNAESPLAVPLFVLMLAGAVILALSRLVTRPSLTHELEKPLVGARQVVPASPFRILAFMVLTVLVAVLLISLQNGESPLAAPIFIAVVIGGVILAVASAPADARRIILTPALAAGVVYRSANTFWKSLVAILVFYRFRIAALSAFASLGLMILCSQAFQIARINRTAIDEPVKYMLAGGIALGISIFFARPNIALPTLPALQIHVFAHVNKWIAGLGVAVLLFLSVINGKASATQGINTDTQFWLLILGISMVVMGLSGWQPLLRLPPLKWRLLFLGMLLVVVSNVATFIVSFGVFLPWANDIINAIVFVMVRLGDVLVFWAFVPPQVKLPRPTLEFNRRNVIWLVAALSIVYVLASLGGTIFLDLAFALAVNQYFWVIITLVNFVRVVALAFYNRLMDEQPADPPSTTLELDTQNPELTQPTVHTSRRIFPRISHYAVLTTIILVAIFARFYLLNDTMRFLIDEESFIGATHYLRAVPTIKILAPFSSIAAFPYMYPYLQLHTIDIFGKTLAGLRAASGIMGVLGVIALYFLARTLFDRKTALLAALFLAVLPVHIQFSRIGISESASPVFGTLAFAFIGRGLLRGRRTDFAIGGAMLGLTHYFHEGGRLLYTPLAIAWVAACLIFALRQRNTPPLYNLGTRVRLMGGDRWRNLLVAFVALVIVAAPIYYTLIVLQRPLFARMVNNNSGLGSTYWSSLSDPVKLNEHIQWHLLPAFQVYVNQVDNTLFYADENAFILPALIPIFLFGVFYAVWRWRSPGMLLLLMWLLSTSLGNSLMVDSAGSPRYVMVFPALALACAVGLRYTVPLLIRNARRAAVLIAIAAVGLAFVQVNYFFNDHLPAYNITFRAAKASPDGYDAALRSMDFPSGTNVHIISANLVTQIESIGLLGLRRDDLYLDTLTPDDFTDEYIGELRCRVDHAFFIERTDFRTLDKLRTNFFLREAQLTPYDDFLPSQRLILFYAPYLKGTEKAYDRKC